MTLRGTPLAIVRPPEEFARTEATTVRETLDRLRPLLLVEPDLEAPGRPSGRPSATDPLPD